MKTTLHGGAGHRREAPRRIDVRPRRNRATRGRCAPPPVKPGDRSSGIPARSIHHSANADSLPGGVRARVDEGHVPANRRAAPCGYRRARPRFRVTRGVVPEDPWRLVAGQRVGDVRGSPMALTKGSNPRAFHGCSATGVSISENDPCATGLDFSVDPIDWGNARRNESGAHQPSRQNHG